MGGRNGYVFPFPLGIDWISIGPIVSLRFGEFELVHGTRQLVRRGTNVHLSPKAFELLSALINRRPNAVSKQDTLWPSTFVAESNLAALVNEIRRALGDEADRPKFVRTVPRFGYAFCGEATEPQSASATTAKEGLSCWLILEKDRVQLAGGENIIGRDPEADVWIDLPTMSRRHARIVITGDEACLEDLRSKNGTSVGGQPMQGSQLLRDRDVIMFGSVQVIFRAWLTRSEVDTQTA
jgi:DNA-binding winged helix-turn-helix (wHTH) protein